MLSARPAALPPQPWLWTPSSLPWDLRRRAADLLHVQYIIPPAAPCPVITTIHDISFRRHPEWFPLKHRLLLNLLIPLAARNAAHVITGSEFTRADLIDSPATVYPETAEWASAYFHSTAQPDGLVWNARQDRDKLAFVLYGRGRVARSDLRIVDPPLSLFTTGFERVLEAADKAGITIVH